MNLFFQLSVNIILVGEEIKEYIVAQCGSSVKIVCID